MQAVALRRSFSSGCGLTILVVAASASGQSLALKSRSKLINPQALDRLLQRGELALVESKEAGATEQVILFDRINASPGRVHDAIMDVAAYPKFLRTIKSTRIIGRRRGTVAFSWTLDVPFFDLEGTRAMRGKRPWWVQVRGLSGHFKRSQERWELYPLDGGKRTLLAFYRSLDLASGGFALKMMTQIEPSSTQAINIASAFIHMRSLKRYIEDLPETKLKRRQGPVPKFASLDLPVEELQPLMKLGYLALFGSYPDGTLRQVSLFTTIKAPQSKIYDIVSRPEKWPEFMPNFAEQQSTRLDAQNQHLEWELEIPLFNLSGTSRMTTRKDGSIDIVATGGDIKRGRWRWEFKKITGDETLSIHYAYTDVAEASWIVGKIIDQQPLFEHGVVVASASVGFLAIKARAEGRR